MLHKKTCTFCLKTLDTFRGFAVTVLDINPGPVIEQRLDYFDLHLGSCRISRVHQSSYTLVRLCVWVGPSLEKSYHNLAITV